MSPIPNRMAVATIVISTLTEQSFKNTLHEALCARDLTQFFYTLLWRWPWGAL